MSRMSFDDESTLQKAGYDREPRWDEAIKWHGFVDDNTPYAFRLVAGPTRIATHWLTSKKKTGDKGKPFAVLCCNYNSDPKVDRFVENGCVVCDLYNQLENSAPLKEIKGKDGKTFKVADLNDDLQKIKARTTFCTNAISRDLQTQGPPSNNSGKWSYLVPLKIPQGCSNKLIDAQDKFNKHKVQDATGQMIEKVFGLHHRYYGKDVMISYNSKAPNPSDQYQIYLGPKEPVTPLTDEELGHAGSLVNFLEHLKYPSPESVKESLQKSGYYESLDGMVTNSNLKTLTKGDLPRPQVSPVQSQQPVKTAFDVDSEGIPTNAPTEDDIPDLTLLKGGPVNTSYHAPAQTTHVPPTVATPAPQQHTPPFATKADGTNIQSLILSYATTNGLETRINETKYAEDLRYVQAGTQIPQCFSKYQAVPICKGCPIRVDCMLVG